MRPWLALALLIFAAALAWLLVDGSRGVAASREVEGSALLPRDRNGPARLAEQTETSALEPAPEAARSALAPEPEVEEPEAPPPNSLDVRVLSPDGAPWANGALRVQAADSPILKNHQPLFSLTDVEDGSQPWMSRFQVFERESDEGVWSQYRTDAEGRVRIVGVVPDQPFALIAVDGLGAPGGRRDEPPMALGERREVVLYVTPFVAVVAGTCTDESGAPLEDVSISVRGPCGSLSRTSDALGGFATGPLFAERITLVAEHDGYGAAQLADVETHAGPFVLRLRPARDLRVRLVGARGGAPPLQGMRLVTAAQGYTAANPRDPRDEHVFYGVARVPGRLVLDTPLPQRSLEVDPECESLTWTVPEVGILEVRAGRIEAPAGQLALAVVDALAGGPPLPGYGLTNAGDQLVRDTLWEGDYTLQVLRLPAQDPERPELWGAPIPFAIRAGETTRLSIGR